MGSQERHWFKQIVDSSLGDIPSGEITLSYLTEYNESLNCTIDDAGGWCTVVRMSYGASNHLISFELQS